MKNAIAHLGGFSGKPHSLSEHLNKVSGLAGDFALDAAPGSLELMRLSQCAGALHDLGKYRAEFQSYLRGTWKGGEKEKRHAVYGAAAIASQLCDVAFAVLGHHAGLHDFSDWKMALTDPELNPLSAVQDLLHRLEEDWAGVPVPWRSIFRQPASTDSRGNLCVELDYELRTRMVFSCLVDADYLDTEAYYTGVARKPLPLDAATLSKRLSVYIDGLMANAEPTVVNEARREVLDACRRSAMLAPGLFRLTAPTGSGKTLAAMSFALEHAKEYKLRRVIVVLPFLAIIEQNARIYREVLGEDIVLEHHSAVSDDREDALEDISVAKLRAKQTTENWDAPVVVTTAVQFLESLFSRRPGRCRKLHNIARSVVIFDEVQTLPFPVLDPILSVLGHLSRDFGVSSLLCSATRPAFAKSESLPSGFAERECREVIEDRQKIFTRLGRARLELPFLTEGKWSWEDLADRLEGQPKALVIVNLRKQAQDLFDVLKRRGFTNLFHLSSTMCPAHREKVLGKQDDRTEATIYGALKIGRCLVISTQVIEAGVDIDFPLVYRAVSPLDSIIQAAGRCNREGIEMQLGGSATGRVIVFAPEGDCIAPPGFYSAATEVAIRFLDEHSGEPNRILEDPEIYAKFHTHLIARGDGRDPSREIQRQRRSMNFKAVDALFKVIEDAGQSIIVPYGEANGYIQTIRLRQYLTPNERRKLQRFSVSLMPNWIDHFLKRGVIEPLLKIHDDGPLCYIGQDYDHNAIGLRLGELPVETFSSF